jgi:pimeloyl-ACP methyl ester carboxylesterase
MTGNWKEDRVLANGIHLHFWRSGGQKPPLVLLHGITDNGLCWSRLANVLQEDYDLILLDARGHGFSDAPGRGYSMRVMAEDTASLVYHLKLGRPGLIGHSMGAATAAMTAAYHPKRVGCLVLEDPPWWETSPINRPASKDMAVQFRLSLQANRQKTLEELTREQMAANPSWDASEFPAWSESKHQVSLDIANIRRQRQAPYAQVVQKIACPTLLITGDVERGAIVTPELASRACSLNPFLQSVHIPSAGHNVRRENFAAYLQAVKEFLQKQAW